VCMEKMDLERTGNSGELKNRKYVSLTTVMGSWRMRDLEGQACTNTEDIKYAWFSLGEIDCTHMAVCTYSRSCY
jgi:hypothetical protein